MKHIITILTGLFLSVSVFAQNRVVYGKLTVFNNYPVMNVEVSAKKSKATITTDSLGRFSLVCEPKDVIQVKPKTFKAVNKRVGPETDSLNINLLFIDTEANRDRAIANGYMNREDLLYAVAHLQQQNNDFCSYTSIFELIRGRFSGVTVSDNHIYVRGGVNSFTPGASHCTYFVNGVEVGSLDWIDPCQIATINVLKDSNAAIYGSRGGNGVVVVTTRNE